VPVSYPNAKAAGNFYDQGRELREEYYVYASSAKAREVLVLEISLPVSESTQGHYDILRQLDHERIEHFSPSGRHWTLSTTCEHHHKNDL
jgi:hypothetical protein